MFYDNFINLCNKAGKSPSAIAEEMGYQRSVVTRWSKGTAPRRATLQRVADYFGVSISYFENNPNEKNSTPEGVEQIPNYDRLNDANKVIVQTMIAQLLVAQSDN